MHEAIVYRWRSLPGDVRNLFLRSFTDGLAAPGARVHEHEWRTAFRAMAERTFHCPECGYENVVDVHPSSGVQPEICGYCQATVPTPPVLMVGRKALVLEAGMELTRSQLFGEADGPAVMSVVAHPERPRVLGLRNLGADAWRAQVPGYSATAIGTGKTIRLLDGLRLELGGAQIGVANPNDPGDDA